MNPLLYIEKRVAQAAYHAALVALDEAQHELERQAITSYLEPLGKPAWVQARIVRDIAEISVDDAREHLRSIESAIHESWVSVPYVHSGFECGAL